MKESELCVKEQEAMKILFLTRVYPPIVGGLENQSFNLINSFKKINKDTFTIINTKGKKNLLFFIPYSFFKALYLIWKNKIRHLHLSDGVLTVEGYLIKKLTGVKTAITIHGLDITYRNCIYQKITPGLIKKLDKIICVSAHTKKQCIERGVPESKITVIPNGVNSDEFILTESKELLRNRVSDKLNIELRGKKILLSAGRLVKRKGFEWFISNVMSRLKKDYIYLISGDGEERKNIEKAVEQNGLSENVFLLGRTDSETLKLLYNSADLFVMPNIQIEGDMEGFGIVAIEAGSCGLTVIASDIEGIRDAVINGKTGWLVKEKDVVGFIHKIKADPLNEREIMEIVRNKFHWEVISSKYTSALGVSVNKDS